MRYNLLDVNTEILNTIPNLSTGINTGLTTDGIGEIFQNLATILANSLSRITNLFTGATDRLDGISKDKLNVHGKELYRMSPDIDQILTHGSYINVEKLKISTIVGLKSNMLAVTGDVVDTINRYSDKVPLWLVELEDYLTLLATTPDSRTASRPVKCSKDVSIANKDMSRVLTTHINPKIVQDTVPLGKLYPNMYSIGKVYDKLLAVSTGTKQEHLIALKETVTKIAKLSNDIYNKVKINEIQELSKSALSALGYLLEENAKLVTNYITIVYLYNELVRSLSLTITRIK